MSNEKFSFQNFIEDSKNAVLSPKEYFTTLSITGGFGEPVIKAVIYGFIAGVFALLWSLFIIPGGTGMGSLFGGAVGIMAFIGAIIGALIGLFIGGVIVLIISAICNGSNDYEANVRVVAAMMVLMPINAFLNIFDDFIPVLGNIFGLMVNLYGLWMLYHALNQTLKAKAEISGPMISGPMIGIGIGIIGFLIGGFVGFLARPSTLLIGQLPFEHVISRGANFHGMDQVLVQTARQSFNITLIGAIIGAIAGMVIGFFVGKKKAINQKLKAKAETSKIIALVLGALVLLFAIIGFGT